MAGTRLLTFEITSPTTFTGAGANQPWSDAPRRISGWVGFVPNSGPTEQSGTYVVGGKCSTFTEMVAVVDQLKFDLDRILEAARAALPR